MKKGKYIATDILFYAVGCMLYSIAITSIITPNEISPGGVTGIATVLDFLLSVPTGFTVLLFNIPILIAGFLKLGSIFIIKTGFVTTLLSICLEISEALIPPFKTDSILASIFGGLLMGAGLSLVLFRGATTGGVDIIAKLVNMRFNHITVGKIILAADVFVIALAAIVYRNFESSLYSVIALYVSSYVTDTVLYGSDKGKIIYVVTTRPDEISRDINKNMGRGVTKISTVGTYTGNSHSMLMCTVRPHEVSAVNALVRAHDSDAFTVISEAGEIIGEGFRRNR